MGAKVVIVPQNGRAIRFGSGIVEVADALPFLAINANDRTASRYGGIADRAIEWSWWRSAAERNPFEIRTSDALEGDRYVIFLNLGDLLSGLASPFQPRDGLSGRLVLQKNLDLDYFGAFFSPADARRPFCARSGPTS
jgi:hypothetical protein